MEKMLLHIPHSSVTVPEEYRRRILLDDRALNRELLKMTDMYTDELFAEGRDALIFPISRLVCDVERFRDPAEEHMTEKGMWVVYSKTSDLSALRRPERRETERILREHYDRHHSALTGMTENRLGAFGEVVIIDCHSFSSSPLPYEDDRSRERPDICIGTDSFHTPEKLRELLTGSFEDLGYSVKTDSPYSGCLVPMEYYRKESRVQGAMIEINRSLYMDESTGEKLPFFKTLKEDIRTVLGKVLEDCN